MQRAGRTCAGATFAIQEPCWLPRRGATLAELMGRLGHTTPGAALRYKHAALGRDAEIARRLSALVSTEAQRPDESDVDR